MGVTDSNKNGIGAEVIRTRGLMVKKLKLEKNPLFVTEAKDYQHQTTKTEANNVLTP